MWRVAFRKSGGEYNAAGCSNPLIGGSGTYVGFRDGSIASAPF